MSNGAHSPKHSESRAPEPKSPKLKELQSCKPCSYYANHRLNPLQSQKPVLTDFDQGHFRQGTYDIACLLHDPVVGILSQHAGSKLCNPGPLIDKVWLLYSLARTTESPCGLEELNTHLSLQAMNALHGPAAQHWSDLDDKQRAQVAGWAVAMLGTSSLPQRRQNYISLSSGPLPFARWVVRTGTRPQHFYTRNSFPTDAGA